MFIEGVDYSFGRPGGAALAKAGKAFAIRYVPYPGDGGKGLTKSELADLHAHGISVALVFESTAGRVLSGASAGKLDARTSLAMSQSLGFPARTPIYFAVDFDAQSDDQPVIDAYLRGAATVLGTGRVGVYGGIRVINRTANSGSARWFWQTYAWSAGGISDHAHLLQYHNGQRINGAAVDFVLARRTDFGQWAPPGAPAPLPAPQEEPMGLITTLKSRPVIGTLVIPAGTDAIRVSDGDHYAAPAVTRVAVPANLAGGLSDGGYLVDLRNDELHFIRQSEPGLSFSLPDDPTPYDQADVDAKVAVAVASAVNGMTPNDQVQARIDQAVAADRAKAQVKVVYE